VPLLTITPCLLQPLSQNHPSGIQLHTQLHLPERLSLAAASLLTEVRAGADGREDTAEAGERQDPAWAAFPATPFPHPAVPSPFSAAPAVQPEAASGLWRRWHGEAQVPLLLQHHPVEQARGLGRQCFLWGAGRRATVPSACVPQWHWQLCLPGEVGLHRLPHGGVRMRLCSPTFSVSVFDGVCERGGCSLGQAVFSSRSSLVGKRAQVPTTGQRPRSPSGASLAQLSTHPRTPSLWFLSLLLSQ